MERKIVNAINAIGVLIKTPHIATYLAKYDPKALSQAKAAFYGFTDEEITEATRNVHEPKVNEACADCGSTGHNSGSDTCSGPDRLS